MKGIKIILAILVLLSCDTKKSRRLRKDIIGEWTFVKDVDARLSNNDNLLPPLPIPLGYIFFPNNTCENKLGYYKKFDYDQTKKYYLGNRTRYKIDGNKLKIFDLSVNKWYTQKIVSIIEDTLTVQIRDSVFSKYVRAKYKINPNESYDRIIVSTSGCMGSCPQLDISIEKNGDVLYYGKFNTSPQGIFYSKITKEAYSNIEDTFKKAELKNIKDNYEANWTDDETITVTFIKNQKIIKSITDYGSQSPPELIWAYTPIRYLHQHIRLIPFQKNSTILPIQHIHFETNQQICDLTKSESFYLMTEILRGKVVKQRLKTKYLINFWNHEDKKEVLLTDGKLYKFKEKTIDIGYNFITQNNLKFRTKND